MFDSVDVYVRTIDWNARLAREIPPVDDLVKKHVGISTRQVKVLDLGCGPGFHLAELARRNPSVAFTGTDIDRAMIEHASAVARREGVHVDLVAGDFIENQPVDAGLFDVVYCVGNSLSLIWGCGNLQETFNVITRMLAPGGDLFFQVLNSQNPRSGYMASNIVTVAGGTEVFTVKRFFPDRQMGVMLVDFITFHKDARDLMYSMNVEQASWTLHPWASIERAMAQAGLCVHHAWGNYAGLAFDASQSTDLICVVTRA